MIKVKRIDHVAIVVAERDEASAQLAALFGLTAGAREHVASQATDVTFLYPSGAGDGADGAGCALEVCAPRGNAALERFLARRGPGLHHVCYEVDDLRGSLAALKSGAVPLIDEEPRLGSRGHHVAFLHPSATGGVLVELCQRSEA
ncbi:MAG TPA: VOC family protein [Polyangia bacterium]|nr:VOC family protein [Polyangia bacterium]